MLARTREQRRFDALIAMAARSAALPADTAPARPLFTVVVDHERFKGLCELASNLTPLQDRDLVRHLGDFDVERIVFGPDDELRVQRAGRYVVGPLAA